eukprot:2117180-Rhodomonas_salina.1
MDPRPPQSDFDVGVKNLGHLGSDRGARGRQERRGSGRPLPLIPARSTLPVLVLVRYSKERVDHVGVTWADGEQVSEESGAARWGAELLGVEEEALVKALTSRHIQ